MIQKSKTLAVDMFISAAKLDILNRNLWGQLHVNVRGTADFLVLLFYF